MSERKVLNKYYPPDFDPSKIPRGNKGKKNATFEIRLMAPFNMKCKTCGEYIYKGKKFNSRKETVENETYLGLLIFRFYIKCPMCLAEISFRTDPKNADYEIESGATRNFEAMKTAEKLAREEEERIKEEESGNPMKLLENRTKASKAEMEELEALGDLQELKKRHEQISLQDLLNNQKKLPAVQELDEEEELIKEEMKYHFGKVKRLHKEDDSGPSDKIMKIEPTNRIGKVCKGFDKVKESINSKLKNKIKGIIVKPKELPAPQISTTPKAETEEPSKLTEETKSSNLKLIDYGDSDED